MKVRNSFRIKIYQWGIHRGEEAFVRGNQAAGMIVFSGCHLSCSFCYTPEASLQAHGKWVDQHGFVRILNTLRDRGAGNITLISPTHYWSRLEPVLSDWKRSEKNSIPIVLKVSGYQTSSIAWSMKEVADTIIPDYKAVTKESARSLGLPSDYGQVAADAMRIWSGTQTQSLPVVRHLIVPGQHQEARNVIQVLGSICFKGRLNLMTRFVSPKTRKLVRAPRASVDQLLALADEWGVSTVVDGRAVNE